MLDGLNQQRESYDAIRALKMPNSVAPAYIFNPLPPAPRSIPPLRTPLQQSRRHHRLPHLEDLAFTTVREQAELLRTKKITSLALTQMYLTRLKRYDQSCTS